MVGMSSLQNAKNRNPELLRTAIDYSTAEVSASPRTYPKGKLGSLYVYGTVHPFISKKCPSNYYHDPTIIMSISRKK
jgi:hypothetical protein